MQPKYKVKIVFAVDVDLRQWLLNQTFLRRGHMESVKRRRLKATEVVEALPAPKLEAPAAYLDLAKKANDVFYDQIRLADQKAAYIFTLLLAVMITSVEGKEAFRMQYYLQDKPVDDPIAVAVSILLAIAAVVSLVSAIFVVLPRKLRTSSTSLFWGTWSAHRQKFQEALAARDPDFVLNEYLGNADNLATIARSKYRYVTIAFRGLVVTVLLWVLLLLIS
ncbi:Pycsar system effector family protein [Chelativorans sp.]|uniref:Pycsar system effector family protein n=1 Tax=Chelativorans sp. TaxID=2203393 RepID=UPI0028121AE9|nr:Pycsar system effector family protein [Chelativorans sp.]